MTMTALAPLLLLAAADPGHLLTADEAMQNYRERLKPVRALDCPRDEEIVVCGRKGADPNRPPLPYPRDPGAAVRLPGEGPTGTEAFGAEQLCFHLCEQPLKVNLIGAARVVGKTINHLLGKDD
jgi:hypothetical protein